MILRGQCCAIRWRSRWRSPALQLTSPLLPTHVSLLLQDPRFMYLSLDEACTHVDAAAFRLVIGIYDQSGSRLLGTGVSPPVR